MFPPHFLMMEKGFHMFLLTIWPIIRQQTQAIETTSTACKTKKYLMSISSLFSCTSKFVQDEVRCVV
jgi:hypothetical protein